MLPNSGIVLRGYKFRQEIIGYGLGVMISIRYIS